MKRKVFARCIVVFGLVLSLVCPGVVGVSAVQEAVVSCPGLSVWVGGGTDACVDQGLGVPDALLVRRLSSSSVKLGWQPVRGASGYRVYQAASKNGKYRPIATVRGGKVHTLVVKRLAKRTVRYYKVRAWRVVNGRRVFSPATYWVSARTWVRGDKYGNLRQVEWERGEKPTVTLGYGGGFFRHPSPTVELTGLPLPARTGCLDVSVRWVQLSGFEVVRMTKPGVFYANSRSGVARFRAVVHTGQFVTVTATVADFQHPAKLTVPAYMARPEVMAFVNNLFPQPFQQMFDYAVEHEIKGSFRLAENSDELLLGKGQTPPSQEFETLLRAVLENYPYTMLIVCFGKNGIDVHMQRQNQYGYTDSSVITYSADDPRNSSGGLAPHWYLTQNIVIS